MERLEDVKVEELMEEWLEHVTLSTKGQQSWMADGMLLKDEMGAQTPVVTRAATARRSREES